MYYLISGVAFFTGVTLFIYKTYGGYLNFARAYFNMLYGDMFDDFGGSATKNKQKIKIVGKIAELTLEYEEKEYTIFLPYDRVLSMNMKNIPVVFIKEDGTSEQYYMFPGLKPCIKPSDLNFVKAIFTDNFGEKYTTEKDEILRLS